MQPDLISRAGLRAELWEAPWSDTSQGAFFAIDESDSQSRSELHPFAVEALDLW